MELAYEIATDNELYEGDIVRDMVPPFQSMLCCTSFCL